ncbi:MAG: HEPN domain-containing protein [Bryobacteraceae bacterium]
MKPPDPEAESLLREWIEKAEADLEAANQLAPHIAASIRLREIVGFHCQQAVEKFLKALLTYYQVEFPKTHDVERLLTLVRGVNGRAAEILEGASWLGPFGVEIRYPGDAAEMLPGDEVKAIKIACAAKDVVLRILAGPAAP